MSARRLRGSRRRRPRPIAVAVDAEICRRPGRFVRGVPCVRAEAHGRFVNRQEPMMNLIHTVAAVLVAMVSTAAAAQQPIAGRNGVHPAIVAQRVQAQAGYDYASKFYPHPAWLYLRAEAPRPMSDHPALIAWRAYGPQQRAPLLQAMTPLAGSGR
jgi:hypothetical protein